MHNEMYSLEYIPADSSKRERKEYYSKTVIIAPNNKSVNLN